MSNFFERLRRRWHATEPKNNTIHLELHYRHEVHLVFTQKNPDDAMQLYNEWKHKLYSGDEVHLLFQGGEDVNRKQPMTVKNWLDKTK